MFHIVAAKHKKIDNEDGVQQAITRASSFNDNRPGEKSSIHKFVVSAKPLLTVTSGRKN